MPRTIPHKRHRQSVEAQLALAERVLRNLHKSIDQQLERARDLEVEHAVVLYKSGKATLQDGNEIIQQALRRVG